MCWFPNHPRGTTHSSFSFGTGESPVAMQPDDFIYFFFGVGGYFNSSSGVFLLPKTDILLIESENPFCQKMLLEKP